jgi:hypothetical protein
MKYMKILGLLAVAAAALMAFAATASATLTSPTGTVLNKGAKIHSVSEGLVILDPPNLSAIECESTVEGEVGANGGTSGKINHLTLTPCNDSWHVTATTLGELEIEADGIAGTYNGTVYAKGTTVSATRLGVECGYALSTTTKIGTFTGGNPGTMHIEANIPIHSGSTFFCGTGTSAWIGDYKTTAALYVDG